MTAQINLYHSNFRKKHLLLPFSRMSLIAALTSLIIPAMVGFNGMEIKNIEQQSLRLSLEYQRMEGEWKRIQVMLSEKNTNQALAAKEMKLETILNHKTELLQLTKDNSFINAGGYSDYLIALARQHIANIWLTKITIKKNGTSINIEGKANHAAILPDYLQRLTKEPAMAGKTLETLRMKRDDNNHANSSPISFVAATTGG